MQDPSKNAWSFSFKLIKETIKIWGDQKFDKKDQKKWTKNLKNDQENDQILITKIFKKKFDKKVKMFDHFADQKLDKQLW